MSGLQLRNYSWLQTDSLAYGETKSDYDNFDKFQTYHHATKFFVFRKIKSEDFSQVPWFLPKREVVFLASKGGLILTLLNTNFHFPMGLWFVWFACDRATCTPKEEIAMAFAFWMEELRLIQINTSNLSLFIAMGGGGGQSGPDEAERLDLVRCSAAAPA